MLTCLFDWGFLRLDTFLITCLVGSFPEQCWFRIYFSLNYQLYMATGHCNIFQFPPGSFCLVSNRISSHWFHIIAHVLFCQRISQFFGLKPIFLHRYHLTLHIAMEITSLWRLWIFFSCPSLAQTVKSRPSMQETKVQSLGQEDYLEKGMGTHSSILAWRIPWTEEPGRPQSMGSQKVRFDWVTNTFIALLSVF